MIELKNGVHITELTKEHIEALQPSVFADGSTTDDSIGINMSNSGKKLRWVAVRGEIPGWKIYIHHHNFSVNQVANHGDKVTQEHNIRKLIPCTDECFKMYEY